MAAPDEVTIKTSIVPDKKGADDAVRTVKNVGVEAEKSGKSIVGGFDAARGAVSVTINQIIQPIGDFFRH